MMTEPIRIAKSALSDTIYAGRIKSNGFEWKGEKHDVTNDFLAAVITRWAGYEETITAGDKVYKIRVEEVK